MLYLITMKNADHNYRIVLTSEIFYNIEGFAASQFRKPRMPTLKSPICGHRGEALFNLTYIIVSISYLDDLDLNSVIIKIK